MVAVPVQLLLAYVENPLNPEVEPWCEPRWRYCIILGDKSKLHLKKAEKLFIVRSPWDGRME